MGVKTKSRIFLVAALAATLIAVSLTEPWLANRLSVESVDELYWWLHLALWLVIAGVVVEEWELIWGIAKFARYTWDGRFLEARGKIWDRRAKIAEGVGFIVLVIGLAGELAISPLIEARQKADELTASNDVAGLQHKTEVLRSSNDEAEREILRLQAKFAWRTLSDGQLLKIANAVAAFPHTPYDAAIAQDAESLNLLGRIAQALASAHWDLKSWGGPGGPALRGHFGKCAERLRRMVGWSGQM